MNAVAPWSRPDWHSASEMRIDTALTAAGRPPTGPVKTVKTWARSCVKVVPTEAGEIWVKHGYDLPPGEERVLDQLAVRWADRLPRIVATWDGAIAMDPLAGRELTEGDPVEDWVTAATALAELQAGEVDHVDEWLALGVRDRRADTWQASVERLANSPTLDKLDSSIRRQWETLVPDFIARYPQAFQSPATLVPQDSGCCNIHVAEGRPIFFDWADVVVGHATFSCDRLLDQARPEYRQSIIDAFIEPLGHTREEFTGMRRSNVLHEVLRYHDELSYIATDDPAHASLSNSVRSQIRVLVEHEMKRKRDQ